MNDYEILLMLDVELPEERASEVISRVRERVEGDGGRWDGHEPWGRRKLAYEIDHKTDGIYHLLLFAASPATLAEVSRVLNGLEKYFEEKFGVTLGLENAVEVIDSDIKILGIAVVQTSPRITVNKEKIADLIDALVDRVKYRYGANGTEIERTIKLANAAVGQLNIEEVRHNLALYMGNLIKNLINENALLVKKGWRKNWKDISRMNMK